MQVIIGAKNSLFFEFTTAFDGSKLFGYSIQKLLVEIMNPCSLLFFANAWT